MPKKFSILTLASVLVFGVMVGVIIGMVFAFWVAMHRQTAVQFPEVSQETINARDALIVSIPDHNPWGHSNLYSVRFDYDHSTVDIEEIYVLWNPFSRSVRGRPPIVVQTGLLPGQYSLRFWDGRYYTKVGTIVVSPEQKILWQPSSRRGH